MSIPFPLNLPLLRAVQRNLMTETVTISRYDATADGEVVVATLVPCRKTDSRLFAEPADPQDANLRSLHEAGFTLPIGTGTRVGDRLTLPSTEDYIAGEVLAIDTWVTAERVWANRPKTATPFVRLVLFRDNDQDGFPEFDLPAQYVQLVYDRIAPEETPIRYAPGARTSYKGGSFLGPRTFNVRQGDVFTLGGYAGTIEWVLPYQPQRTEARFVLDISGVK